MVKGDIFFRIKCMDSLRSDTIGPSGRRGMDVEAVKEAVIESNGGSRKFAFDERYCLIMREMAADGFTGGEISRLMDCSKSVISRHVGIDGECSHDKSLEDLGIERVDFSDNVKGDVTPEMCGEMRRLVAGGETLSTVAQEFDVSKDTVHLHVSDSTEADWICSHNTVPRVDLEERRTRHPFKLEWKGETFNVRKWGDKFVCPLDDCRSTCDTFPEGIRSHMTQVHGGQRREVVADD